MKLHDSYGPSEPNGAMLLPDEVPAAVQAAVSSFVPPSGYVAFPMPTKNNAQRSLIYFYGRRVQSTTDTRKSKWFCLASPQCRANGTIISTSSNISGCTRHLHVFHDLLSPKTVQMNRKSTRGEGGKLPDDQLESGVQDQNQPRRSEDATRERTLEWTICFAIRQLLPIAPLVNDPRLEKLLDLPPGFDEQRVKHHIVEIYASTLGAMKQLIQSELSRARTALLHLSLGLAFNDERDHNPLQVALTASFVTSEFELKRIVLGVTQIRPIGNSMDLQTAFRSWILRVVRAFGIDQTKHIRSCTIDNNLGQHTPMVKAVLEASSGRPCDISCVDRCLLVLNRMRVGGCLNRLVSALEEFADVVSHSELGKSYFQHLKSNLEIVALGAKRYQHQSLAEPEQPDGGDKMDGTGSWSSLRFWLAVGSILVQILEMWPECEMFFSGLNQHVSNATNLLRTLTKNDVVQALSILQPIVQFVQDMAQTEYPAAPEAIVRMIAIKHSILSIHQPLHLVPDLIRDGDTEMEIAIPTTELTIFGTSLRQELASRWDRLIEDMLSPSMSGFVMCAFFHPCFRQLGFLERQDESRITPLSVEDAFGEGQLDKRQLMIEIKRSAREIFLSKATPLSSPTCDFEEGRALSGSIPTQSAKKRRKTQLARQAEELARLGFLEETTTSPNGRVSPNQDHTSQLSEWVLSQEFDRYLKHESAVYSDIPFDQILSYWQRKTLEYPTIALVAQSALGTPVSAAQTRVGLNESKLESSMLPRVAGHGRVFNDLRCSEALTSEEMTLFLHFNQVFILPAISTLADGQVALYMASSLEDQP